MIDEEESDKVDSVDNLVRLFFWRIIVVLMAVFILIFFSVFSRNMHLARKHQRNPTEPNKIMSKYHPGQKFSRPLAEYQKISMNSNIKGKS